MDFGFKRKTVLAVLTEEDQSFQIGPYNVNIYFDPYWSEGKWYYGCEIIEFNGSSPTKKKWLYIEKENTETLTNIWEKLHHKSVVKSLLNHPNYSKVKEIKI